MVLSDCPIGLSDTNPCPATRRLQTATTTRRQRVIEQDKARETVRKSEWARREEWLLTDGWMKVQRRGREADVGKRDDAIDAQPVQEAMQVFRSTEDSAQSESKAMATVEGTSTLNVRSFLFDTLPSSRRDELSRLADKTPA